MGASLDNIHILDMLCVAGFSLAHPPRRVAALLSFAFSGNLCRHGGPSDQTKATDIAAMTAAVVAIICYLLIPGKTYIIAGCFAGAWQAFLRSRGGKYETSLLWAVILGVPPVTNANRALPVLLGERFQPSEREVALFSPISPRPSSSQSLLFRKFYRRRHTAAPLQNPYLLQALRHF
jgi:hypothetical protein